MSNSMSAMRWRAGMTQLRLESVPVPSPTHLQVQLDVLACGVCRTDLHLLDGDLAHALSPLIPGHEIVGRVVRVGAAVANLRVGDRVGVPWLGHTCGVCPYCRHGAENLCDFALFTGYTLDGGYAQCAVADARYCLKLPANYSDAEAAPLLCAGLIGYRAYRAAGQGVSLGLYGFGAAAHLLAQLATQQGRRVFAFTRKGDLAAQDFARSLGAVWAGCSEEPPPESLDAAVIFAPVGSLVVAALRATRKGGRVVCAGIHMSDIPGFPYELLWGERSICSVANLTRTDGIEFMKIAERLTLRPTVHAFPLEQANEALTRLRDGRISGAAVLIPNRA